MFAARVCFAPFGALRAYSTGTPVAKPSLQLVAQLRKLAEGVSILKAREALTASGNDIHGALEWIEQDLVASGAKRAAKVGDRVANEGLVSVSVLAGGSGITSGLGKGNIRAAMIELNCETDFVGRNDLFGRLAADIAHTAAFISEASEGRLVQEIPLDLLNDAPLLAGNEATMSANGGTVASSIRDMTAKIGERVFLRRAVAIVRDPLQSQLSSELSLRIGRYVHGSIKDPSQGRLGGLTVLALKSPTLTALLASDAFRGDLEKLERALVRQVVGMDTTSVSGSEESALYNQPFGMAGSDVSVCQYLRSWAEQQNMGVERESGLEVLDFVRWTVGETVVAE